MTRPRKIGDPCSECGTGYDECTDLVLNSRRTCCRRCQGTDTHNERTAVEGDKEFREVLELLRPLPKVTYPTPWRVAEDGPENTVNVVCAAGHWVCQAASVEAARAIVVAANTLTGANSA